MLYPSLDQPIVFVILFCAGIIGGILCLLCQICVKKVKKYKFLCQICYFFTILAITFIYTVFNLIANYGQFRVYTILSFCLGMIVFNFFTKKLWTKLKNKCYNFRDGRKTKGKKEVKENNH